MVNDERETDPAQVRRLLERASGDPPPARVDFGRAARQGRRRARLRTTGGLMGAVAAVAAVTLAVPALSSDGRSDLPAAGRSVEASSAGVPKPSPLAVDRDERLRQLSRYYDRLLMELYRPAPGWQVVRRVPCGPALPLGPGEPISVISCQLEVSDGRGVGAVLFSVGRLPQGNAMSPQRCLGIAERGRRLIVHGTPVLLTARAGMLNVPSRHVDACSDRGDRVVVSFRAQDRSEERGDRPTGPGAWEKAPLSNSSTPGIMYVRPRAASLPLSDTQLTALAADPRIAWIG